MAGQATDEDLMLAFAKGDAGAFDVLYKRHKPWLHRVLLRSLKSDAMAQDVFQDAWLTVVRNAATYQVSAKFTTWLYQLAHSRMIDALRKGRHEVTESQLDPLQANAAFNGMDHGLDEPALLQDHAPDPSETAAWRQFGERLSIALDGLPMAQREAFVLWVESEMTVEQIGVATGAGTEAAKSRLRYARAKLKAQLSEFAETSR
jgi:RNA polymerase sigma-70 factor (ECF subfamily)